MLSDRSPAEKEELLVTLGNSAGPLTIRRNPVFRPASSICRCPFCARGCCRPNRTALPQLLGELSLVSGLGRKSNLVAPFQPILFFDWLSKPCLDFRSRIYRHLIVSRRHFNEQNLCAWC